MINLPLTPKIKEWLDTPEEQRDYAAGALLVGQVSRNRVLFRNLSRNPEGQRKAIEYHLDKIYRQRLVDTTREEVKEMMQQCDRISQAYGLQYEESKKSDFRGGNAPTMTSCRRRSGSSTSRTPTCASACATAIRISA